MLSSDPAPNVQLGQNGSVPAGGSTGEVLLKTSGTDYDIEWGAAASVPVFPGLLFGLTLSNNAGSPTTAVDVAAGQAVDSTAAVFMALGSTLSKSINAAWAVGTGQGGLDTGSVAANTWYHVHLIERTDTGVVDALFSLSATAPTLPTNYSVFRRLGSVLTNGSSGIIAFSQSGDTFLWSDPPNDVNTSSLSTSGNLLILSIPSGVQVESILQTLLSGPGSTVVGLLLLSPDQSNVTPTTSNLTLAVNSFIVTTLNQIRVRSNTSSQIRSRSTSATGATLLIFTIGWVDTRGRLF